MTAVLFSEEEYSQLIKEVKEAKQKQRKDSAGYRGLKGLAAITVSGYEKLIAPVIGDSIVLYYLYTTDVSTYYMILP
jgi:hypothetical protein